jgi:Trk K+ transport system NAD-binding subunit
MLVMAIKSADSGYHFNPSGSTVLQRGDILIVVGTREQIARLHETSPLNPFFRRVGEGT